MYPRPLNVAGENRLTPPEKLHELIKFLLHLCGALNRPSRWVWIIESYYRWFLVASVVWFRSLFRRVRHKSVVRHFVRTSMQPQLSHILPLRYLGIVLAVVVTGTGIFSYMQEAKADATMEAFASMAPEQVTMWQE